MANGTHTSMFDTAKSMEFLEAVLPDVSDLEALTPIRRHVRKSNATVRAAEQRKLKAEQRKHAAEQRTERLDGLFAILDARSIKLPRRVVRVLRRRSFAELPSLAVAQAAEAANDFIRRAKLE